MTFTANIDKKYTIWQNASIQFEAENEAEARELLEEHDGSPPGAEYLNSECLFDTEEPITVGDNGGVEVWELKDIEAA